MTFWFSSVGQHRIYQVSRVTKQYKNTKRVHHIWGHHRSSVQRSILSVNGSLCVYVNFEEDILAMNMCACSSPVCWETMKYAGVTFLLSKRSHHALILTLLHGNIGINHQESPSIYSSREISRLATVFLLYYKWACSATTITQSASFLMISCLAKNLKIQSYKLWCCFCCSIFVPLNFGKVILFWCVLLTKVHRKRSKSNICPFKR